ncbi:hypothetical protein K1719_035901 [Acacia pycnantha]|nr:hypothetical protein K1719_035901 [Acacia pycnantha]
MSEAHVPKDTFALIDHPHSSRNQNNTMTYLGGWELVESVEEAACRESLEEAGVVGIVEAQLGQWRFIRKRHGTRLWMSVGEAKEVCQHWWMKEALDILADRLIPSQQQMEDIADLSDSN